MALKSVVDSLDGIDEKYHALYAEKDGKFHLDAEVAPPANDDSKLGEFRENNRKLFEQNQTLEGRVKTLETSLQGKETEVQTTKTTADERIAALEAANQQSQTEASEARASARKASLSDSLGKIGAAQGVKKSALGRFSEVHAGAFDFDDDGAAFVKGEGGRPMLSKEKPGERMAPEEYVANTLQTEDFWLDASGGDGAGGDGGGGGAAGVRTISKQEAQDNWSTYEKDIAAGKVVVDA